MGTMRKTSHAPRVDFKTSITEHPQRQDPGLDGHFLFSFVLIKNKQIFAKKHTHFFEYFFADFAYIFA